MRRWRLFIVATALVTLLLVPMAFAARGGTERPFKATMTGTVEFAFPGILQCAGTEVTTLTEATGQATHLGRIAASWSHCPAAPLNTDDGRVTLVAANGDELRGTYDYDPASPDNFFPVTLAGGTGRFTAASGAVVVRYNAIPELIPGCVPGPDPFPCFDFSVPWQWSATMTGTISY